MNEALHDWHEQLEKLVRDWQRAADFAERTGTARLNVAACEWEIRQHLGKRPAHNEGS